MVIRTMKMLRIPTTVDEWPLKGSIILISMKQLVEVTMRVIAQTGTDLDGTLTMTRRVKLIGLARRTARSGRRIKLRP